MRTIRRLYFYLVAFISLEVVLWGLIGLLRSMASSTVSSTADALAQALALILVGVPIFLVHWLWSQRISVKDTEERTASLRAIFLYAALFATLSPVVQNLLALINRALLGFARLDPYRALIGSGQRLEDNLIAIAVNGVVAYYFWRVLQSEWDSLPEEENFADVRRLHRYLWLLYTLLMVVFGAQQTLRYIFYTSVPDYLLGNVGREMFSNGLALLIVGTPLWAYVWRIIQSSLPASVERDSNLRLGVFYLLSLVGVVTVLSSGGRLLDVILSWAFGEQMAGHEFIQQIGGAISLGLPMAGLWAYYSLWLNRQIASDEDGLRRAGKQRFYNYILSALGLGASVIGLALILSFVIDITTANAIWGESMRSRLAAALSTLAVGLPLWLTMWMPAQAEALSAGVQGEHARRSPIRRAYLYLALFAGVIGGMVSAVTLAYYLVNALLTGDAPADFLSQVLNVSALLSLFAFVLFYHLRCLQADNRMEASTLVSRQREFSVLLFDPGEDAFVERLKKALTQYAPGVPVHIQPVEKRVDRDAQAVILPVALAVNPPDRLRLWLKKFSGEKVVVTGAISGWVVTALSPEQAAVSVRQLAEGEKVQLKSPSAAWEVIKIIAVVILGLELLFFLFALGISVVVD
ncbi:MAG: hypothetical protein Kow002_08210 [Anaerolineales bacterium]